MKLNRRHILAASAGLAAAALPGLSLAQNFPSRPIRLVVGYAPATAPDVLARFLAQRLTEQLKQQVVVENKPGAGGQIAAQTVAKAASDGYTLLLGEVGSISIAPAAFSKLSYNPTKELVGIAEVARVDFLLTVPADAPYQTVAEFVKFHRTKDDRIGRDEISRGQSVGELTRI